MALYRYWTRQVGYYGPHSSIEPAIPYLVGTTASTRRSDDVLLRTRALVTVAANISGGLPPNPAWLTEHRFLVVAYHNLLGSVLSPDPESGDPNIVLANWLRPTLVNQPIVPGNYYVLWEQDRSYDTPAMRKGNAFGGVQPQLDVYAYSYDLTGSLGAVPGHSINLLITTYTQALWGSVQPP